MKTSPLGKYSALVAAIVIVGVIAAAIVSRALGHPDSFLDGMALAAFGLVAGTAGSLTQLNGTVKRTEQQDLELQALRARATAQDETIAALAAARTRPSDG